MLASKYGLPDRAFVLGDQAPFISMAVEMSKDHPELLSTYLHGVVADLRVRSMSLNNLPEGELEGWIGGLADFVRSNLTDPEAFNYRRQNNYLRELSASRRIQKFHNVSTLMKDYMGQVRDYEIICPRAEGFADTLPGRKVVLIGKAHIPNVERVLQGGVVEKPKRWTEHVRSLSGRQRREVGILEKIPSRSIQ